VVPLAAFAATSYAVGPAAGASASHTVQVGDFFFKPSSLHISKGTTVTWRWVGHASHNVTFRSHSFSHHSKTQSRGSYSLRFTRAGTFHYLCTIHFFTGTIFVK
jgi:plastocyanin